MLIDPSELFESAAAALLFALVFLAAGRLHPLLRWIIRDHHIITSFSAGVSAAYVFVHVMPELTHVRQSFAESYSSPLPYRGASIYFIALLGFLAYYGLDKLELRLRQGPSPDPERRAFRIHVGGFAIYVWLVSYLLVRGFEHSHEELVLYTIALGVHFLTVDNTFREEYAELYERIGRFVLAAAAIAGWAMALALDLGSTATALLTAFITGAVIVNSAIAELPPARHGRFVPFMSGGLIYGALLVVLA